VLAVAEWLVRGKAAPAERDHGSPSQAKLLSLCVLNREFSFNADRSVVDYRYFRWHAPDGSRFGYNHPKMRLLALACVIGVAQSQDSLSQLAEIKERVAANLRRLPNYTCTETIERSRRRGDKGKFQPLDRVRLEVALVDNKELFGWPGGERIAEAEITNLVGGTIGNGDFGLLEHAVFFTPDAVLSAAFQEARNGRDVLRYEYRVPLAASGYHLKVPPKEALVAYHGSFWVDARSLELQSLVVTVDAIPMYLGISAAVNAIEFAPVEIGGANFRLPHQTELKITDHAGWENRNQTSFRNCHQFLGESVLKFVEEGTDIAASQTPQAPPKDIQLPDEFSLSLSLQEDIDIRTSAIGDLVTAVLEQSLRANGENLAPKGAVVRGRIVDLIPAETGFRVHIELTSLDLKSSRIDLGARKNLLSRPSHPEWPAERPGRLEPNMIKASYAKLPAGTRLDLISRAK
jgi:hypothetical protein